MSAGDFPDAPKRDIPVEGPSPEFQDAFVNELVPRLSEEAEAALSHLIATNYYNAIQDRREWEDRLSEWEDAYYNRTRDKDFPWPGASNFHVPITMSGVEMLKPRLTEVVLGQYPPILVVPTTAAGEENRLKVETVLNWQILNSLDIEPVVAQSAHLFLQPGLAVAKTYWDVVRTTRKFVRDFPRSAPLPTILETLFGRDKPQNLEERGPGHWEGEIPTSPQGGPPLQVVVKLNVREEGIQVLVEREEVREGPRVDLVDPIDLFVPVKGGHDIMDLPWVSQRLWWTQDQLRAKAAQGRFYPDAVQALIDSGTPKGDNPSLDSTGYRESQDKAEGVEGHGPSNVRQHQYDLLETYLRYDVDEDGRDEEIIAWSSVHIPGKLLGWDYLDNVYAHGRRPLRVGRFFPIPFRFYGLSYAEMIRGIQEEINAIHNQRIDSGTLANMPWGFKRGSSTLPAIQQRIRPGEFIDTDNPQQDINIPKFNFSPAFGQQEEATLMQYKERLDGLSDLTMGRQPNRVGATRTAKGTQTLLNESGLRAKTVLQAFQRFWVGIFEDVLALDQEYLPPHQEFRITGRTPTVVKVKDRADIAGKFNLRLSATSENLNREQMRNDGTVILQAIMNPSLIQAGIVGMKGIRRAMQDFLKSFNKDPDFYLEPQSVVRDPVEELMLFAIGQYVSPTPGENVQVHLAAHEDSLRQPFVSPEVKQLIHRHYQETVQLAQAQQMARSLQGPQGRPPVGPQATNAAQGALPQGGQPGGGPPATSQEAGLPVGVPGGGNGRPQ